MAGLFTLIWGAAIGVSAAKHANMNSWCKKNSKFTLPNGVEYYCDADGKYRLLNGTQIFWKEYGTREKVIEIKTGKVIYDKGDEINRENEKQEQMAKQKSSENGNLLYIKRNERCYNFPVFFEFKTGKQLAQIAKITYLDTKEIEYRKWYFYDHLKESLPYGANLQYGAKTSYDSIKFGDKGVVITKEEFEKIKEESRTLYIVKEQYKEKGCIKICEKTDRREER